MYIFNTTFMLLPGGEGILLELLTPVVAICREGGLNPRVSVMKEAGGAPASKEEASSVAFQVEFNNLDDLRHWEKGENKILTDKFTDIFAPEAMTFTSVFETVDI